MDEKSLRQVQASIAAKKVSIPEDEARDLARRLLAQADAAEHPRHCGMPGVEVTEFVPVTAGAPA